MKAWRLWGLLFSTCLAACSTKQNPAATCTGNGMCTDPAFPYCDVDGAIAGQPGACIAAECAAGSFGTCDGSNALLCNAMGEGYDTMPCVNGCDPVSGCITCTANSESCANNVDTKCDANSTLTMTPCAFGCSASGNSCATPVPSNSLETYFDMTVGAADLDLEDGDLELDSSMFTSNLDGSVTTVPSFDVPAPSGGAPVRVFVVDHLTLGNISISSLEATQSTGGVGRALAFLAISDIQVTGDVTVSTGALATAGCVGVAGAESSPYFAGAGGGGNATAGGNGGGINDSTGHHVALPGTAGTAAGVSTLVPLGGGCPGGSHATSGFGGSGGGAIQLMSRTLVNVTGAIEVDGAGGDNSGGGAGGSILIEAPAVTVGGASRLLARGGGGGAGNASAPVPPEDGTSPPGGMCNPVNAHCSDGGEGAPTPFPGSPLTLPPSPDSTNYVAGSGGGGLGRIRVNTADGTFTPAPTAILAADTTNGTMLTD